MFTKNNLLKKIALIMSVVCIGTGIVLYKNNMSVNENDISKDNTDTLKQGQIFLYGELHAQDNMLKKELEIWGEYYADGMRDLFIEYPCFTAEFLNMWMQSEDNDIFEKLYADWEGIVDHCPEVRAFYMSIKENYPDTVFHGTDVGHHFETGERYLEHLRVNGEEDSEKYKLASESLEHGKIFHEYSDSIYRENMMTKNFIREFEALNGTSIMGIYGGAHTQLDGKEYQTKAVPCMASQLKERYGEAVHSEDMSSLTEPLKTESIQIGNKEYEAAYYGQSYMEPVNPECKYIRFWRLEDAYEDMKERPVTGDIISYVSYPMEIAEKQVFLVEFIKSDGSVVYEYYRSDENMRDDLRETYGFIVEETSPDGGKSDEQYTQV